MKIVVLSLIAGILVVGVGLSARPSLSGIEDNAVAVKVVKPATYTSHPVSTIR